MVLQSHEGKYFCFFLLVPLMIVNALVIVYELLLG